MIPALISQPVLRRRPVVALLSALLAVSGCAFGQTSAQSGTQMGGPSRSSSVNVRIYSTEGRPIEQSANVTLRAEAGGGSPLEVETSTGVARFDGLVAGRYDVAVTIPGFKQGIGQITTLSFGVVDTSVVMEIDDDDMRVGAKGIYIAPAVKMELDQGKQAMQSKDYDKAETHLLAAYKLAPGNPQVNDALGELYILKKELDKSQDFLVRAAGMDPEDAVIQLDLGQLRITQANFQAAEAPLEKSVSLEPKSYTAHWLLGIAYLDSKEYEKARSEADECIKLKKGGVSEAEFLMGEALAALGRNEEAIAALQSFLQQLPNDFYAPSANHLLAQLKGNAVPAAASPSLPAGAQTPASQTP